MTDEELDLTPEEKKAIADYYDAEMSKRYLSRMQMWAKDHPTTQKFPIELTGLNDMRWMNRAERRKKKLSKFK